ncbi:DUF4149 domain-containing protein [Helicobacter trogontum]|uniref:DUF4149 domain-containing protein n=1 Tax=Helicobacter trogontum TaxID=50960 RepID=A0A4U8TFI2_9HELI|nr:DUF4149 domain-containing protein [Helicobacter trogontum]MDY5185888.1 DUF4149 domain-containing protein [Helicobacter trogontum]TLD98860.1 DUF4149 domain-containing protein [Helicobacter trogontum]
MARYMRIFDSFYLLLLGVGVGGIIACGAFSAPIIFNIDRFIPSFSKMDSGLVMGKIFVRLNVYLVFLAIIIALYESFSFFARILKLKIVYSNFWPILGVLNIILIALFVYYYTPFILDIQNLSSDKFLSMHEQSVWVFKALMFTLSALFIWRLYLLHYVSQSIKK